VEYGIAKGDHDSGPTNASSTSNGTGNPPIFTQSQEKAILAKWKKISRKGIGAGRPTKGKKK
jgi:hypothetical protein